MTLQICMACPAHILASTELRAVTNARGTSDNDHSSQADLYPLGHSGLLTGAMGIWNSRDNVFTSAAEPNCAKGACVSPDFRLQNVAALLAGGPCKSDGASRISARLSAVSLTRRSPYEQMALRTAYVFLTLQRSCGRADPTASSCVPTDRSRRSMPLFGWASTRRAGVESCSGERSARSDR